jgi:hypothetical protein
MEWFKDYWREITTFAAILVVFFGLYAVVNVIIYLVLG